MPRSPAHCETCPVLSLALVKRKDVWLPTLRGWVVLSVSLVLLAAMTILETIPFLSVTHPVHRGVLVVEGWLPDDSLREAAEVFQKHPYRTMLVTGIPLDHGQFVLPEKSYSELGMKILAGFGVDRPRMVRISCPTVPRNRTVATAHAVRTWLHRQGIDQEPVDVVTLGVHARRTWLIYDLLLRPEHTVGIIATAEHRFPPDRWWTTSAGVRTVLSEWIAYLYGRLFFHGDRPTPE